MRRPKGAGALAGLLGLLAVFTGPALAQTGPLPPGEIVTGPVARGQSFTSVGQQGTTFPSIANGIDANGYLGLLITPTTLSFVNSAASPAVAILTTAPTQYVRFYAPGSSNQAGSFLVGSNQVRGLTATQVRDVLALPYVPTMQTVVRLPAGTCLLIGTGGPILTPPTVWGNGGAVQEYLIGRSTNGSCSSGTPGFTGSFVNGQSIGAGAFLYAPHLGGGNAGAVAAALDRGPYPALFSGMDGLYNALDLLNDGGNSSPLRNAMLQLDGEVHASTQSVLLGDSLYLRQALLGRMRQASFAGAPAAGSALASGGPALAYAGGTDPRPGEVRSDAGPAFGETSQAVAPETDRRTALWVQGVGAWGSLQGNDDAAGLSRTLAGFIAGADHRFASNWFAGIAGGYTTSSVSVADRQSAATVGSAHLAVYTGASFGAWNLRAAASASLSTVTSSRTISFPGFVDGLGATYTATTTQLFGEAGYGVTVGKVTAEPFAGMSVVRLDSGGFTERGTPGIAALASSGTSTTVGFSTLGARAATDVDLGNETVLTPRVSIAWQHAYGTVAPTATLSFASNGAAFTTTALPLARDSALIEAGATLRFNRQLAFEVSYLGQFGAGTQDTWLTGRFSLRF
ncbi:MAG: autotransporter outer membrane beta-barrel domain-containing protein [Enhydrobacter sp.]|nr:autotransporter outer membrane beta-barrel domain-containing protein [Enhydrobacter sp.]